MIKTLACVAAVVLLSIAIQGQAGITGKWQGETRNGAKLSLDVVSKDGTLTGTFTRNEEVTKITEGKVSKNTFTFKATINDRADEYAGELAGDDLKIWAARQGPTTALVLKRVKN